MIRRRAKAAQSHFSLCTGSIKLLLTLLGIPDRGTVPDTLVDIDLLVVRLSH
jgi:hypothetical protein